DLVGPNHVLLGPMSPSELRRAIQGPAERTGLEVEPALADALVDEVAGEAGGLPLLSTALLDLWRERKDHSLTLAAYARTGAVRDRPSRRGRLPVAQRGRAGSRAADVPPIRRRRRRRAPHAAPGVAQRVRYGRGRTRAESARGPRRAATSRRRRRNGRARTRSPP